MKYILFSVFLFLSGCKDVPRFPTHEVFEVIQGQDGCTVYPVIKENPITLGDGIDLPKEKCPESTFGFHYQDIAEVMDWIRDMQKLAEKRCK